MATCAPHGAECAPLLMALLMMRSIRAVLYAVLNLCYLLPSVADACCTLAAAAVAVIDVGNYTRRLLIELTSDGSCCCCCCCCANVMQGCCSCCAGCALLTHGLLSSEMGAKRSQPSSAMRFTRSASLQEFIQQQQVQQRQDRSGNTAAECNTNLPLV